MVKEAQHLTNYHQASTIFDLASSAACLGYKHVMLTSTKLPKKNENSFRWLSR